ncbi:zinc finger, CCHC-type containing protein [Tanacetum coccineum]
MDNPKDKAPSVKAKLDKAWEHVTQHVEESGKKVFICNFCSKIIRGGGINRVMKHLAGRKGEVAPCTLVDLDVRLAIQSILKETDNKPKEKVSNVVSDDDDDEEQDDSMDNPKDKAPSVKAKLDKAWEHVTQHVEESGKKVFICNFCSKIIRGGGINRVMKHLAGRKGEVAPCTLVDPDVRLAIQSILKETDNKPKEKVSNVVSDDDDDEEQDDVILLNNKGKYVRSGCTTALDVVPWETDGESVLRESCSTRASMTNTQTPPTVVNTTGAPVTNAVANHAEKPEKFNGQNFKSHTSTVRIGVCTGQRIRLETFYIRRGHKEPFKSRNGPILEQNAEMIRKKIEDRIGVDKEGKEVNEDKVVVEKGDFSDCMPEFCGLLSDDGDKVVYAVSKLRLEAKLWWGIVKDKCGPTKMTWIRFKEVFKDKFCPITRFAEHLVATEERKIKRYLRGLRIDIRELISTRKLVTFWDVVEAAQDIENTINRGFEENNDIKRKRERSGKNLNNGNKKTAKTQGKPETIPVLIIRSKQVKSKQESKQSSMVEGDNHDNTSNSASVREQENVSLQCPNLTETNYTTWALLMETILKAHGLWKTIDTKDTVDEKKSHTSKAMIFQTLPEDVLMQVAQCSTTRRFGARQVLCIGVDISSGIKAPPVHNLEE